MKPHQFRSPAVSIRRTKSAEQIRRPLRALLDCCGRAVPQPFHLGWAAARAPSTVSYSPVLCSHLSASAYNTRAASSDLKKQPDSLAEVTPRLEWVSEFPFQRSAAALVQAGHEMPVCAWHGAGLPTGVWRKNYSHSPLELVWDIFTIYNVLEFKNKPVLIAPESLTQYQHHWQKGPYLEVLVILGRKITGQNQKCQC